MTLPTRLDRYEVLLHTLGIADVPVATPLDLAQLPIVRPTLTLDEKLDAEGKLPSAAWEVRAWQTDPTGARREVIIRGSPTEGLPYGRDGDVILALCQLIAEGGHYDGVLQDVSLQKVAAALGKELDGREARRIVSALSRLAAVQIEIVMPIVEPDEVERLLVGEVPPQAPPRTRSRRVRRAKFSLLKFVWDTETVRYGDGSTVERVRIRHLAMEPLLIHYAIAGGVAWIDRDAYMAVGDSPIARSLYQFVASEVARGRVGGWSYDMLELRDTLGLNPNHKPARVRALLEKAGALLKEHRVLQEMTITKGKGRGAYQVDLLPGPLLGVARLLRGVGLHELAETRVQLLLLGSIGINGTVARKLTRESANDVYLALAYLLYVQETDQRPLDSPAGWVISTLRKGLALDTDRRFVEWLEAKRRAQRPEQPALPFPARPPRELPRVRPATERLPARDPRALSLWGEILPSLQNAFPSHLTLSALAELSPFALEDGVLVLRTVNSFAYEWVAQRVLTEIESLLEEKTHGEISGVRMLVVESEAEELDEP